jgi:hypothetical protein
MPAIRYMVVKMKAHAASRGEAVTRRNLVGCSTGIRGAAWSLRQYEINLDTRPPMPHGPPPSDSRFRAADPALPPAPAPPVPGSLRRRAEVSGTLRQSAFVHCNSDRRAQGSSRSVFALVSERACDLLKALLPVQ